MRFLREPHAPPPRPTPVIPEPHSTCDWATGPWPPTHTGCWLSCRHPSRHCRPGPHRLPGESRGCWTSPCRPGSRCCLLPELPGAGQVRAPTAQSTTPTLLRDRLSPGRTPTGPHISLPHLPLTTRVHGRSTPPSGRFFLQAGPQATGQASMPPDGEGA